MSNDWFANLRRVSPIAYSLVLPTVVQHCKDFGGGDFRTIEGKTRDELCRDLDVRAGIDAYQRFATAMRGIALRIQDQGKDWRTFTVRVSLPSGEPTEYSKRLYAIKNKDQGLLYPYWTIQAYVTPNGELLSLAVAKTEELYLYIEKRFNWLPRRQTPSGEVFIYVDWERYKEKGNFCFIYPPFEPFDPFEDYDVEIEDELVYPYHMSEGEFLDWVEEMEAVSP